MIQEVLVTGAKSSKGEMEGRLYDSTKVYVQTKMNDSGKGFATAEYNWGDSTNFDKIKDLNYPFKANVEFEIVTSGKNTKMILISVMPIDKIGVK